MGLHLARARVVGLLGCMSLHGSCAVALSARLVGDALFGRHLHSEPVQLGQDDWAACITLILILALWR